MTTTLKVSSNLKEIEKILTVPFETGDAILYKLSRDGSHVDVPFAFGRNRIERENDIDFRKFPEAKGFVGTLRPLQEKIKSAAMKNLGETGSVIISAEPGFGKTITTIEMMCRIDLPTVIFVKQSVLVDQWKRSISDFAPHKKVVEICSKKPFDEDADVYIVNPIILKNDCDPEKFSRIKLLIVDELHQIVTRILCKAFFGFRVDYVIGLSATPYRPVGDPMGIAIEWFFGNKKVGTTLFQKHIVKCIETKFCPKSMYNKFTKKLDWNHVLTEQASDENRNDIIIEAVTARSDKIWLVLVKRVEHAKTLKRLFAAKGFKSETMTGADKTFDKSCKILIGTTSKVGVGFDHAPINALCMAADVVEYFEQFLGRCMRRKEIEPVVVDFDDPYKPLKKHLMKRLEKYELHGGVVERQRIDEEEEEDPKIFIPERKKKNNLK
jgi:superfamily II DNA or RNA helicase